eukprot:2749667-Lingulodinium_polyedra.AAC.1
MAPIALTECNCIDCADDIPNSSHATPKQRPNQHSNGKQHQLKPKHHPNGTLTATKQHRIH